MRAGSSVGFWGSSVTPGSLVGSFADSVMVTDGVSGACVMVGAFVTSVPGVTVTSPVGSLEISGLRLPGEW